jgi:prepilin peptidase CpaA
MIISRISDTLYLSAALLSAGVGSVYDIRSSRIPNVLTASSIAIGLLLHLILGGWSQLAFSFVGGLIGGGLFLIFFLLGGMGAGDVKLMAAVGCLVGLGSLSRVLIATVLVGATLALLLAFYRGRLRETITNVAALAAHYQENGLSRHDELSLENVLTLRMPYAVPIAIGCMAALWMLIEGGS